jgi:hypothetical protein
MQGDHLRPPRSHRPRETAQSRLGLEGRTRTLSGPSPDLTSSVSGLLAEQAHVPKPGRDACGVIRD